MGNKKKNKNQKKRVFSSSFKDLLKESDVEIPTQKPTKKEEARQQATVSTTKSNPTPHRPIQKLSDDELFAQAIDTIDPKDLFAGKYVGDGHALPKAVKQTKPEKVVLTKEEEAQARVQVEEIREEAYFAQVVGHVQPLEVTNKKYRAQTTRNALLNPKESAQRGYTDEEPEHLYTPTLDKEGEGLHFIDTLNEAQRGLLKRYKLHSRRDHSPTLNLHGDSQEDALRQLELFVHKAWKDKISYVKIIHGKGLGSQDQQPVIKPTVLHWLEGPGLRYIRAYAPILTQDRNYGSLVVAIDTKRLNPQP